MRNSLGLASALTVMLLTGCAAAPESAVTSSVTPDSVKESDAVPDDDKGAHPGADSIAQSEDETRARAAFDAYVVASDAVLQAGGRDVDAVARVVTQEWFETEKSGFERIRDAGLRQVGDTLITVTDLAYVAHDSGQTEVALYACQSTENLRIVDAEGVTVSGPATTTLVTVFVRLTDTTALVDAISPAADSTWCLSQ
jgi:hypothetical protein